MLILIHVIIALFSVACATYTFFAPSKSSLYLSYALIASTLISGTYLIIASHASLLSSCMSGLIYITVVSFGILPARKKLAASSER